MNKIEHEKRHLKTVSLFCGIGGMDLGFLNAGFDIIWSNDINKYAVESYRANIGSHVVEGDINNLIDEVPEHDVLLAGFPCQPFSMMGKQKGFDDDRGTLFFTIETIIKRHNTKIIVLENVKNLLTHNSGNTFKKMKEILEKKLGYSIHVSIINTADYGIPQTRRRVFIVGFKNDYYGRDEIKFNFPEKLKLNVDVRNFLDKDVDKKYFLSEKVLKTILAVGTKSYSAKPEINLHIARPLCATMHKMHRASQDNYYTDDFNRLKFVEENKEISNVRRLTPNECRKLQGFPEDWKQVVSDTQAYMQFGNAVTVEVAYYIANEILKSLNIESNPKRDIIDNVNLEHYSFFGRIKNIVSTKDKKIFKCKIENFINCVYEICSVDENLNDMDKVELDNNIIEFLLSLGAINELDEIAYIKQILKKDFSRLIIACKLCVDRVIEDKNINKFMNKYRKKRLIEYINDRKSPTIVDFFCGSGGLSLGFHREGYKILLANDIEEVCTCTYSFNHEEVPNDRIIHGDIKEIVNDLENLVDESVDVVMGGPPCQGFSMANRQRMIDDPRNELYRYFVKAVEKLKPKFLIMENVKGMLSVADQVKEDFHNLDNVDYDVEYHLFNAKNFSVPQNRERLIYVGIRSDIKLKFNINASSIIKEIDDESKLMPKFVLEDALYGLRELKALCIKNATELDTEEAGKKIEKSFNIVNDYISLINDNKCSSLTFNHKSRFNNNRDIEIYNKMIPGDKSDSPRIADIMPYKSRLHIFKDKYYKLKMEDICKTITAHMKYDCNMYIHPNQARGLTPREAARVQSYPDDYFFLGPYTKTYMQIGNSVPPQMSNIFAKIIKKYIV